MSRTAVTSLLLVLAACVGPTDKPGNDTQTTVPTGGTTSGAQAPRAENDLATVDEGGGTTIDMAVNDLVTTNPLALGSITVVSPPQHGTLVVGVDGTGDYTHLGSETTADSYTYTIADSTGIDSNLATVLITVDPVNDPPVAADDAGGVPQGDTVAIDLAANDTDVDDGLDLSSIVVTTAPAHGDVVVNGDGTVDYEHDGSLGVADSFAYTIADASGEVSNVATVDIAIATSNLPPVAGDDSDFVPEGGSIILPVVLNDSDVDDGLDVASVVIGAAPANGAVVVYADGSVSYTHNGSETSSDVFTYRVADLAGQLSNAAAVQVIVLPVNDSPTAVDDAFGAAENATVNLAVLTNDLDPEGALAPATVTVVAAPAYGTAVPRANGTIDYTHDGTQIAGDSFTYTVSDASGATSNVAQVTLTIGFTNDAPVAAADGAVVIEGGSIGIDLAANDTDSDSALDLNAIAIVSGPAYGAVVDNGNGTVGYTHDGSETAADSFTYTIDDVEGATSNVAIVSVTVTPMNDAPVAWDDSGLVNEGGSVAIDLADNDTDADDGLDLTSIAIVGAPANGSLVVNANGTVGYTHNGSQTLSDSFSYTIDDLSGASSNVATVALSINAVNDAPVAVNDSGVVAEGGSTDVNVAANDSDPDSALDLTSVAIVVAPGSGSVVVNGDGTVTYTHNGAETAIDSFTYRIEDVAGALSNVATVQLTVTPVNDAPTAANDSGVVNEGGNTLVNVAANDTDPEGALDLASITIASGAANGSLTVNANGTVTYAHNGSETNTDSFTYRIEDTANAVSNVATVQIAVTPVNDAPVANNDTGAANYQGGYVYIPASSNDTDADDGIDPWSITWVTPPAHGVAYVYAGAIDYYHYGDGSVSDIFTYTIRDWSGAVSNIATISVTIPGGPLPTANDDHVRVATETWVTLDPTANDPATGIPSTLQIQGGPSYGIAIVNGDGTVDYYHDWTSGSPSDSFTYVVNDGMGTPSNVATVTIDVMAPSDCVVGFEEAWDANGQQSNPDLYYNAYGLDFAWTNTVGLSGVVGGMVNGDPGNWSIEGTNGTAAWGMWFGPHRITWDEPVVEVSMDFIRAAADQSFTVYAYHQGTEVGAVPVSLVGDWDFQTVSFAGPLDEIAFSWGTSFMGLDDLRYRAPTLPCPGRITDPTFPGGSVQTNPPYWSNKGYEFVANETFSITGGAWWLNLPVGGFVRLNIYDSTGALLASGNTMAGTGLPRWYHSEVDFTFQAGQQYVASFYTNRAASAYMDYIDAYGWGYDVDGLITVVGHRSSSAGGDDGAEAWPDYPTNSWNPIQRLVRAEETVQNLGFADGNGSFDCPPWWRLPAMGEQPLAMSAVQTGQYLDYYTNIAVNTPSGCYCKWNASWCGAPSIDTYDGRTCGDFAQLHVCVEDR